MMKNIFNVKTITINALIAALYFLLSIISGPLAFVGGQIQIRISEILVFLVFFNPSYLFGIVLGCIVSNIFSMYGIIDVIVGSLATLIAGLVSIFLSKKINKLYFVGLINIVINSLFIPFIYLIISGYNLYFVNLLFVFISELIIMLIGYLLFIFVLRKNKRFFELINATQNIDFKW